LGLLLLRGALGVLLLAHAGWQWSADPASPIGVILGGIAVVAGILLLAGFMTPIAAALAILAFATAWTGSTASQASFPQAKLLATLRIVFATAVALLGPGAFSIDARLFGLREIIIPRARSDH